MKSENDVIARCTGDTYRIPENRIRGYWDGRDTLDTLKPAGTDRISRKRKMRYRIEYHNRHCEYAESQKELEKRFTSFMLLGNIADIRKVYVRCHIINLTVNQFCTLSVRKVVKFMRKNDLLFFLLCLCHTYVNQNEGGFAFVY